MNINRKYIIIFGTLTLLLVFITGAIIYYKEKAEQAQIPDVKQSVLSFSRDHPANYDEISDFIGFCKRAVFFDVKELKDQKIKGVACSIIKNTSNIYSSNSYIPIFRSLDSTDFFESGSYINISVDLKDVVREYDVSLLEKDKLYFCSISAPSLTDSLILHLIPNKILTFDEGNVSCSGIEMDKTPVMIFLGFVPKAESLSIKQYLVNEQIASNVMNKQSFSEIKDILKNYPIIWQMEKPINL